MSRGPTAELAWEAAVRLGRAWPSVWEIQSEAERMGLMTPKALVVKTVLEQGSISSAATCRGEGEQKRGS